MPHLQMFSTYDNIVTLIFLLSTLSFHSVIYAKLSYALTVVVCHWVVLNTSDTVDVDCCRLLLKLIYTR